MSSARYSLVERIGIAFFIGVIAALLGVFLAGFFWLVWAAAPGLMRDSLVLAKFTFLYAPAIFGMLAGLIALASPDKAVDFVGAVSNRVYRTLKDALDAF